MNHRNTNRSVTKRWSKWAKDDMDQFERFREILGNMILKSSYWGYLFGRISRVPEKNFGSIMAVRPELNGTVTLMVDTSLMKDTSDDMMKIIIEHEGMHLLNKHIPRLLRLTGHVEDKRQRSHRIAIFGKAADCTVNEQMDMLRELTIAGRTFTPLFPDLFKLPSNKSTEFYFNKLLEQNPKPDPCKCPFCGGEISDDPNGNPSGGGQEKGENGEEESSSGSGGEGEKKECSCGGVGEHDVGSHAEWTKADVADLNSLARNIDNYLRDIINDSAKNVKSRVDLPSHLEHLIDQALRPPQVPYYSIISKLVKASRLSRYKRCPTRVNRKRTYTLAIDGIPIISPFPGRVRDYTFDIGVILDTSGSVSMDEIVEGLSGVKNIIEKDRYCKTWVIECDAQVQKVYEVNKIKDIQKKVKGRGGTVLLPALQKAKEMTVDVALVFTDGYCENLNRVPRKLLPRRIIWVISKDGSPRAVENTGVIVQLPK